MGKINPSRIPKHYRLANIVPKTGEVYDGSEKKIDTSEGTNFFKLMQKMKKMVDANDVNVDYFGISFDEGDTVDGDMFNALFAINKYK